MADEFAIERDTRRFGDDVMPIRQKPGLRFLGGEAIRRGFQCDKNLRDAKAIQRQRSHRFSVERVGNDYRSTVPGGSGLAVSRGCPPRRGSGGGWLSRY